MMRTQRAIALAIILVVGMFVFWCYRPSLHVAAFYGSTVHARLYLLLGSDVNLRKAAWGNSTPLDVARSSEMVALLKRHGGKYSAEPSRLWGSDGSEVPWPGGQ